MKPLIQPDNCDDLIAELRERVGLKPSWYSGVYFTNDGRAYVIGIIDSLTDFDLKKKVERNLKKVRYANEMTPEGYWGVSCVPPDEYAERFKSFMAKHFHSSDLDITSGGNLEAGSGDSGSSEGQMVFPNSEKGK